MAHYLLVHGAWYGGWCWQRVVSRLRASGHEVFSPTLTGLGERAHLLSPEVDLDTHVSDVLGVLKYEDLREVILVGHSYGGMIITAVAEQAAGRLAHMVYLDAFVPQDGQAMADLLGPAFLAHFRERVESEGEGWRLPPLPPEAVGINSEEDIRWVGARPGDHPFKAILQAVRLENGAAAAALPCTFIYCND